MFNRNQVPMFHRWSREIYLLTSEALKYYPPYLNSMHIYEVLQKLKNQFECILKGCNKFDKRNMLRTFILISKQLEILRIWNNLKFLQLVLVLLAMSLVTTTHYKVISIILTLICIGLVAYIIVDNFITLKHQYEELNLSCTIKPESPATTPSSD